MCITIPEPYQYAATRGTIIHYKLHEESKVAEPALIATTTEEYGYPEKGAMSCFPVSATKTACFARFPSRAKPLPDLYTASRNEDHQNCGVYTLQRGLEKNIARIEGGRHWTPSKEIREGNADSKVIIGVRQ